jgi:hypothetical protein
MRLRPALDQLRATLSEHDADPLPMEWVFSGVAISVLAIVAGIALERDELVLNVLVNLVLLGPGLVLTNIAARDWRLRRLGTRIDPVVGRLVLSYRGSSNGVTTTPWRSPCGARGRLWSGLSPR